MTRPLGLRSAAVSACGPRTLNEDAVLIAALPDGGEMVAVADGMGGLSAGDVASRLALQTVHEALVAGAPLHDAVQAANRAVWEESRRSGLTQGMGTTLVVLHRCGDSYRIANVGDSRAYRVASGGVSRLTRDHSFVAEAVLSGRLSFEEASRSRWKNAVTRAIGTDAHVEVDCVGPFDATEPHVAVLCTDGLYRVVADEALRGFIADDGEPGRAADALVTAALQAGADDNVSVAMVRFDAVPTAGLTAVADRTAPEPASSDRDAAPTVGATAPELPEPTSPPTIHAPAIPRFRESTPRKRHYGTRAQRQWHIMQLVMILGGLAAVAGFIVMLTIMS